MTTAQKTTRWNHAFDVAFEFKSVHENPEDVLTHELDAVIEALIARANYLRARPKEAKEAIDSTCGEAFEVE